MHRTRREREEKIQLRERNSSKKASRYSDIKKVSPRTAAKVEGGSVDLGGGGRNSIKPGL